LANNSLARWSRSLRLAIVALLALTPGPAGAAASARQAGRPRLSRQTGPRLLEIRLAPEAVSLAGRRAQQVLLVTGRYSDGNVRDLTAQARLAIADPGVAVVKGNTIRPAGNGATRVTASVAGAPPASVAVTVRDAMAEAPVSFRDDVIPALTRLGCNQGACHGTPNGKSGFRLSLQGYAPEFDYAQLVLQGNGRRANRSDPGGSLMLLKPMAKLPHGGGKRLSPEFHEFDILTRWIAEGLRDDPPDRPSLERLEVTPAKRVLLGPARSQLLLVQATFSDGSRRDVTSLTRFSSSDDGIATVSRDGLVEAQRRGEVAILCRYQHLVQTVRLTFVVDVPGFAWISPPEYNAIDRDVFSKLRLLQIPPSDLCSDEEFIRRVYLDGIGVLPTPDEVRKFLGECAAERKSAPSGEPRSAQHSAPNTHHPSPNTRQRLIDQVLQRPEFADFWALKWADVLRVSETTLQEEGVRKYHGWIRDSIAADKPMDQFVRELLTADGRGTDNPPANFYRAVTEPQNWMEVTSQVFMGVRVSCARCHNHPFDRWTQDEYYELAAFFSQVRSREHGRRDQAISLDPSGEVVQPRTGKIMKPKLLGGDFPSIPGDADRRTYLARWLTAPDNPFFARALANRVWFHVVGRGIVEPVDDFRDSNPPANDALLATLAKEFIHGGFRLRPLVRFIMNSRAYQLSARPTKLNAEDGLYFSHAVTRLLTAEQLLDAISSVTGVPEDFQGFPSGTRAAQLPGSRVGSPFLKVFGRPDRNLSCECERERDPNLFQALQLITGRGLHARLKSESGRIAALARSSSPPDEIIDELYLAALTRSPTAVERQAARRHLERGDRRAALEDLGWVLVNAKEFLFRH
jgi:hypothetical protein